jgi:hypothetical protein
VDVLDHIRSSLGNESGKDIWVVAVSQLKGRDYLRHFRRLGLRNNQEKNRGVARRENRKKELKMEESLGLTEAGSTAMLAALTESAMANSQPGKDEMLTAQRTRKPNLDIDLRYQIRGTMNDLVLNLCILGKALDRLPDAGLGRLHDELQRWAEKIRAANNAVTK